MPSGRVRVGPPPARTGTGGGTGGGSSGGGYDRYIGTLGLTRDKRANAIFPHYTEFPAANKYDWVQVVSDTTVNTKRIYVNQEFICTENNVAKGTPAKWDLRQDAQTPPLLLQKYFRRTLLNTQNLIIQPNVYVPVPLLAAPRYGGAEIYYDAYRTEITPWLYPYNNGNNEIILDVDVAIFFAENPEGYRSFRLNWQEFFVEHPPNTKNAQSTLLTGAPVDGSQGEGGNANILASALYNASPRGNPCVVASRGKVHLDLYSDFQVVLYLFVGHTAPIPIRVILAEVAIAMWEVPSGKRDIIF